jgi:hypothetical protein
MASIINASSTGSGGIVQTADASGVLQLQSNGTTALSTSGANVTIAGTLTTAAQSIAKASLPTGSVLQVVSTTKTDTFSTTSATVVQITGLTATITPSSTSSKILVIANVQVGDANNLDETGFILYRNSTQISLASGGTSFNWTVRGLGTSANPTKILCPVGLNFLDSPSLTSAITYSIYTQSNGSSVIYINRTTNDSIRATSTITLMEISA